MRPPRSCGRILCSVFALVMVAQLGYYPVWFILFAGDGQDARGPLVHGSAGLMLNIETEVSWESQSEARVLEEIRVQSHPRERARQQEEGAKREAEWREMEEIRGKEEVQQTRRLGDRTREEMLEGPRGPGDCATVEELGRVSSGEDREVARASLAVRKMIRAHFAEHGASAVRNLPGEEFCRRGFVVGKMERDGLGNNLYKLLSTVGLAVMLNRSLIIAEHGGVNQEPLSESELKFPFGAYMKYTDEALSVREVKVLWLRHGCESKFGRRFEMRVDYFTKPALSRSLCDDWTKWENPLVWYKDAEDSVPLQMFLKSRDARMRERARALVGPSDDDRRRPNLFGELLRFAVQPTQAISEAVDWTLGPGGDPDFAIHLRMMSKKTWTDVYTASVSCMRKALEFAPSHARVRGRKLRVALVSDTDESVEAVVQLLTPEFEVVHFKLTEWMRFKPNHPVMNNHTDLVPAFRADDWGAQPRWVAVVDFFLASRAKIALISSGSRVTTTFSQLAAGLAAANVLDERTADMRFHLYSSFTAGLLNNGLARQTGRSMVWQSFSGNLSCVRQPDQCARTPLLPFTWWDLPWQTPSALALKPWRAAGLAVGDSGEVTDESVQRFCFTNKDAEIRIEILPLDWPILKEVAFAENGRLRQVVSDVKTGGNAS